MTHRSGGVRTALALTAALAVLVTAGCGSNDGSGGSAPPRGAGFPVTIDSALGRTEIPAKPQRVVTLGWGSTEAAVALGVIPVGMRDMKSDSGTVDGILPWVKDKLGEATPELLSETSRSIPFERIAALKPDVILAVQSGLTPDQYAQLSRIAPTVAQPGKNWQTSWQDQTTLVGRALGKDTEARKLIDETDRRVADARAANPAFAGKTVAFASGTSPDSLNLYFDTDPRVRLLAGLGFTPLPALTPLRESTPGTFAAPVAWENVPRYNADVLVAWYLDATRQAVEANPVFANLTAVQKKAYVPLTDPPLVFAVSSPNVLDMPWLLERYVPLLQEAAKNAG
ncbi:iron-siderophore ABC transporter substrate-binding protein [Nocardiopsis tropica]|uniref:iron-siderophore ABC transporter substrate-binding protein n=1 Tax=Tsukamurella strandjordii TaxID=147577 RepID=UPI0031DA776B